MNARKLVLAGLVIAYAVMWLGGVGHYVIYGAPPLDAPWAASVFLLLAGVLILVTSAKRDLPALMLVAALGFLAEFLGVRYGFLFSPYRYTDVLQPQLFGVPLVMFSAWLVLVSYCRQMLLRRDLPAWLEVLLAALWMTAIDLVIDPLAANQLGYWRWEQSSAYYGIPLHNFVGWFVVSVVIFALVRVRPQTNLWAKGVGLSIVFFFSAIAFSYRLYWAVAVGTGLLILHLLLARKGKELAGKPLAPARHFSSAA